MDLVHLSNISLSIINQREPSLGQMIPGVMISEASESLGSSSSSSTSSGNHHHHHSDSSANHADIVGNRGVSSISSNRKSSFHHSPINNSSSSSSSRYGAISCIQSASLPPPQDTTTSSSSTTTNNDPNSSSSQQHHLYIGTTNGHIFLYKIIKSYRSHGNNSNTNSPLYSSSFQRHIYMGKKKPVLKMEVDPNRGFQVLFVHWNSTISMIKWDLSYFVMELTEASGTQNFTRDLKPGAHRIACVLKKKLLIFHYVEDDYMKLKELILPETALTMEWYGCVLALGFKRQYCLIDVDHEFNGRGGDSSQSFSAANSSNSNTASHPLAPTNSTAGNSSSSASTSPTIYTLDINKGSRPDMTLMQSELIIVSGKIGVFIHMHEAQKGEPVSRPHIPWSVAPSLIQSCFPFVVALENERQLEIFNIYDRTDMITKSVPRGVSPDDVRHLSRGSTTTGGLGLYMATLDTVYLLSPIPFEQQVEHLIEKVRCTEAFELFDRTFEGSDTERKARYSKLSQDAGFNCLFAQKIDDAFHYFQQIGTDFDVRELLIYFPKLIPGDFIPQRPLPDKLLDLEQKFFFQLQDRTQNNYNAMDREKNKKRAEELFVHCCERLMEYLEYRREVDGGDVDGDGDGTGTGTGSGNENRNGNGKNATGNEPPSFAPSNTKQMVAIDTSLVKLYIQFEQYAQLEYLLSQPNFVDISEVESLLREEDAFLLALLYRSRESYAEALNILRRLDSERSMHEALQVLKECRDESLILSEYTEWIFQADARLGIEIFTSTERYRAGRGESTHMSRHKDSNKTDFNTDALSSAPKPILNPDRVVRFLKQIQKTEHLGDYLEFIITVENNEHPQYHTQLALWYIDLLTTKGTPPEVKQHAQIKLHIHLASSHFYDMDYVLNRLKGTRLYEERIFVYERLGDYEQVIELYLMHLGDTQSAIRYCLKEVDAGAALTSTASTTSITTTTTPSTASLTTSTQQQTVSKKFLALLRVCFKNPKYISFGIQTLNRYSNKMDVCEALSIVPIDLDLKRLHPFISNAILQLEHSRRQLTMMRHVHGTQHAVTKKYHDAIQSQAVRIKANATCCVCGKLMKKTIIVQYPDGTLAHYSCQRDKPHIHPVSGRNFKVEPSALLGPRFRKEMNKR